MRRLVSFFEAVEERSQGGPEVNEGGAADDGPKPPVVKRQAGQTGRAGFAELFVVELGAGVLNLVGELVILQAADFVLLQLTIEDGLLGRGNLGRGLFLFGADEEGAREPISERGHKSIGDAGSLSHGSPYFGLK